MIHLGVRSSHLAAARIKLALLLDANLSDAVFVPLVDPLLIVGIKPVEADLALKCGCYHYDSIITQEMLNWSIPTSWSFQLHARFSRIFDFLTHYIHSRD